MRTKILLTILFFSQLLTLGSAIDYTVNPVNPAQGAATTAQAQPAKTGVCNNGFGWNGQVCVPCMQVKNGYCTCTTYGGCDTKVCDSNIINCQVLTNGQNSYILLRATGCNNYAWGDSNTSVICTQCAAGYFMVAGICVKSNECAQMNLVTGTCDTCVDGFYFTQNFQLQTLQSWDYYENINQVICNKCLDNCKICTSGFTCVQCNDQYYWSPTQSKSALSSNQNDANAGSCMACSANIPSCIKCQNSTTCDKCLDGYYYTAPSDQSTKGTCTKCMTGCLSCQNSDTCDTCDTVSNYIYLQTNNQNSCTLCTSITGCQTCSTQGGQLTCTACSTGYVFDANNVCQKCDVNCASNSCSYNNQVQCSNCVQYFVLKSNTSCVACPNGCQSCSYSDQAQTQITCGQCFDTYYKDDNGACQLCSSSITSCQKCSYNSQNTPSVTCTSCATNTKLTTDSLKCLPSPPNCLDYSVTTSTNTQTCNTCQDTYYLNSGACSACSSADASYLRCSKSGTDPVKVIQCQDGYFYLNDTTCVLAKTQNTQATNLTLQTCLTIATGNQCATCMPAALGTNPPQGGVCSYCNCSSNKADCTATVTGANSSVTCQPNPTCLPGFYLDGQSCLPCIQVAGNITGSETCCGLGLIFTGGTPNSCVAQPGATGKQQTLASNASGQTCDIGYYYNTNSKFCETCISNCDSCADATTCKTCSLNYTLLKTTSDVKCVLIKCLVVDSTKGCTSCQYGFYLSTINGIGYCLQCLSPLTNSICRAYSNQAPNVTVQPAAPVAVSSSPSYVCANGYYWNSQYCSPCKAVPTTGKNTSPNGYCICSTYMDCTSIVCNSGYALVQNTCQEIPKGCSTYVISNDGTTLICTACTTSYSLVSNVCLPSQNCQQFSTTTGNCSQCAPGYYLNWQFNSFVSQVSTDAIPYFNNFPSQCSACTISNCLTCTGPTVCTTCQPGYFWQTSQYLQQPSNGSQGSCQPCMQGCSTCSNNQSCQTCFSGYYMVFPYSGINYCQLCSTVAAISNCLTCDTSQTAPHAQSLVPTCRSCPSGYYLYSGKCVVCSGGCLACDADNSCTQCVSQGYAFDQTNKKCVACPSGCSSCSYSGTQLTCSACIDQYYRNTTNNITICSQCSSIAGKNYLRCVSSTSPTQCQDNYYLNGSSCVAQSNNKCLTYDGASGCTSCITGYIIVGNQCQLCTSTNAQCVKCQVIANTGSSQSASLQCAACTTGYYLTTSFGCTACPNVKGCEACNSAGCQTCSAGYYPTAVTTDSNNSTGTTTSNNTVTCNNCVSNCSICQQANSCTKCADGYFLVTTTSSGTTSVTTSSCFACQPECQTCVAPGTTCTSCIAGYVFQNGGCVTLAQANCYSVGTNGCGICKYGYYLNNGVCYQCLNPQADFLCTNPVDNLLTSATAQQQ